MKDVQLILGLSQEEVAHLLSLLEKADFGKLEFFRGNTYIRFRKLLPWGILSKITLIVDVEDGDITHTNEYIVPGAFIHSVTKKSLGVNAGN